MVNEERPEIPDKLFFSIKEVSRLTGVKPYVLRYWESEFKLLRPKRSRMGRRTYAREEIEKILRIKELLQQDGYTLRGAKKQLKNNDNLSSESFRTLLQEIKKELEEICEIMKK